MTEDLHRLRAALGDRYRIEWELGQGGMATVYLAQDLRHQRQVAIKVLKPELAAVLGAERFVQEIQTTAQLQHPHILPLFDSGEAGGFLYYVMPYIEGETLRDKLNRETQLSVEEAVRITTEVADALDYAHRHGVIHRDIKPENILLHDGRPMVADFGIALALSAAAGGRMTETGMSLGTPHYMSPEQATADKDIGPRSDVYSLASVLYEMLTGQPPHLGGSAQQIIMKIVAEPVEPVTRHRKSAPPHVAAALAKALEKLPADRFEGAKAFAEGLTDEGFSYASPTVGGGVTPLVPRSVSLSWRGWVALGLGAVLLLALGAAGWGLAHRVPEAPTMRFDLTLGPDSLSPFGDVAISPDGSMLAFSASGPGQAQSAIYLRHLDGDPDFRVLAGTEGGIFPTFSPDNQWIAFSVFGQGLEKVSVSGGEKSSIVPGRLVLKPSWGTPDQIVYTTPGRAPLPGGTFVVSAFGGTPRQLHGLTEDTQPFLLPDGSGVLTTSNGNVVCYDLHTDSTTVLVSGGSNPMYADVGDLLYTAEGGLFAVPFDLKSHRVTGHPVRVINRAGTMFVTRGYSVSLNGTLVVYDAPAGGAVWRPSVLVVHTIGGGADTLPLPPGRLVEPRFSPNGRDIAYVAATDTVGRPIGDVFTFDLISNSNPQTTFGGQEALPAWSPDGKRILYVRVMNPDTAKDGLFVKAADGDRQETRLLPGGNRASDWPRADLVLVTTRNRSSGGGDLYTMAPTPGAKPESYLASPWPEMGDVLSPDGRLAAFTARETDTWQVWMRDFPTPKGKWLVSPGGGWEPRWSSDGRYIYYWTRGPTDTLERVEVSRTPSVRLKAPEVVATIAQTMHQGWDLGPDGKRFILAEPAPDTAAATPERRLIFLNWFTTLKAMVKAGQT